MGRIVISGASGDLGHRVTDLLLAADPDAELTLVTRTPEKLRQGETPVSYTHLTLPTIYSV